MCSHLPSLRQPMKHNLTPCSCLLEYVEHWWFSGRILASQAGDPGPIPGQCRKLIQMARLVVCPYETCHNFATPKTCNRCHVVDPGMIPGQSRKLIQMCQRSGSLKLCHAH